MKTETCEYCDPKLVDNCIQEPIIKHYMGDEKDLMVDIYYNGAWVLSAGWLGRHDAGLIANGSINYCPMCGRKLSDE